MPMFFGISDIVGINPYNIEERDRNIPKLFLHFRELENIFDA